jgi:hypothetical protein
VISPEGFSAFCNQVTETPDDIWQRHGTKGCERRLAAVDFRVLAFQPQKQPIEDISRSIADIGESWFNDLVQNFINRDRRPGVRNAEKSFVDASVAKRVTRS